jgi:hypothetical protein
MGNCVEVMGGEVMRGGGSYCIGYVDGRGREKRYQGREMRKGKKGKGGGGGLGVEFDL